VSIKRGALSYNGIAISPDEKYVYVADTLQARLYRFDAKPRAQEPQFVGVATEDVGFDSLAVTAAGNICVATLGKGGITTFTPEGKATKHSRRPYCHQHRLWR
jgi:gluconolactonase